MMKIIEGKEVVYNLKFYIKDSITGETFSVYTSTDGKNSYMLSGDGYSDMESLPPNRYFIVFRDNMTNLHSVSKSYKKVSD